MRRIRCFVVVVLVSVATLQGVGAAAAEPTDASVAWTVEQLDRILGNKSTDEIQIGDMFFDRATISEHRDRLAGTGRDSPTAAASAGTNFWPGGNVYYRFDASVSAAHQEQFVDSAAEWSAFADIRFVLRSTEANFITVKDVPGLGGGNSYVGMIGGEQLLNIGSTSWDRFTVLHEVGHAVGFVHEHQRDDRDAFVTILTANIEPGQEGNFVLLPGATNYAPYDFLSVMHYSRTAFSVDPATRNTIEPNPAYASYLDQMGQQVDRPQSRFDRVGIAAVYGAPAVAPSALVTNTRDSGAGSLRAAMYYGYDRAEATPGITTTVQFHVPATDPNFDGTVTRIRPTAVLPALGDGTTVDGQTQTTFGGDSNPSGPEVLVNGAMIVDGYAVGFVFRGGNSTVRNLVVNGFGYDGIRIVGPGATGNVLAGSYIGTDPSGTTASANTYSGVAILSGAHGNTVGGTTSGVRNVISGNGSFGVFITGAGTNGNIVRGNYIGLTRTGAAVLANASSGAFVGDGAQSNEIGGGTAGSGNVLSGNANDGVVISGAGTSSNLVQGNLLGLNAAGTAAVPNGFSGVAVHGGAQSNRVGGSGAGQGNVLSGNSGNGLTISGTGTDQNLVEGNLIGTNPAGDGALPNGDSGMGIYGGAQSNMIGGTSAGARNVISGNTHAGMYISGSGTSSNTVAGNYIGLKANGADGLANPWEGVQLSVGASGNTVGGSTAGAGNIIAANGGTGVGVYGPGTAGNRLYGNVIGQNAFGGPVGNESGVQLADGSTGNEIGGTDPGQGNLIAHNSWSGVIAFGSATTGNPIRGNSISGNGHLGINLVGGVENGGVTANDGGDTDAGPNNLQNFPVVTSAATGTRTAVRIAFEGAPSASVRVEVFSSPAADPSGFGEGGFYLGSLVVTTDASGNGTGDLDFQPANAAIGSLVTATATDAAGNTSEFSKATRVVPAHAPADFDGDGHTDIAVYRPGNGQWLVQGQSAVSYGLGGDIPVPADYDGNGTTDIAVFRPSVGGWYRVGAPTTFFGLSGDIPVPCDFDGDGRADIAVFRPSVGGWYRVGAPTTFFGLSGDVPVPADYDGDGRCDIAVFRPSVGGWYRVGAPTTFFGLSGDIPVPADYDGLPGSELAVFRPSVGGWYRPGSATLFLGATGDMPEPGPYVGSLAQVAVFRPSEGAWYREAQAPVFFGQNGDAALPLAVGIRLAYFP